MKIKDRPISVLLILASITFLASISCSDKGNRPSNPAENLPPTAPTAITPTDGATGVPLDFTLQWESSDPDGGALTYKVYVGTDSIEMQDCEITSVSEYLSPYGSRAMARQFLDQIYSMQKAYEESHHRYCLNGVSVSAGDSGFYANLGIVPELSDCFTYTMYETGGDYTCTATGNIDSDTSSDVWMTCAYSADGITFSCIEDDFNYPVEPNREYYWQAVAFGADGDSTLSSVFRFTTGSDTLGINGYPSVPELLTPADGGLISMDNLVFSWSCTDPDNDSLKYDLYMGLSQDLGGFWYNRNIHQNYQASPWTRRALMRGILTQVYQLESAYHAEHGRYFLHGLTVSYEYNPSEIPGVVIDSLNGYMFTICVDLNTFICTATAIDNLDNDATVDTWTINQDGDILCTIDDMVILCSTGTTYYWRIAAIDESGHATFSPTWTFIADEGERILSRNIQ